MKGATPYLSETDLFFIGMELDGDSASDYLSGSLIDEFKVYNHDSQEVAYYKFNEGGGDNFIFDSSGNGNHATSYNANWVEVDEFVSGCIDSNACNYNSDANLSDGSCYYADTNYDCNGNCLSDQDNDLICDQNDVCPNDPENDIDGDGLCCSANYSLMFDVVYVFITCLLLCISILQ